MSQKKKKKKKKNKEKKETRPRCAFEPTDSTDSDLMAAEAKPSLCALPPMFRPPVNRAMRTLDRSFFRKKIPLSAATIFKNPDIANVRRELAKSHDALSVPKVSVIQEVRENDIIRKCCLLREGVKYDGKCLIFFFFFFFCLPLGILTFLIRLYDVVTYFE